MQAYCLKCKTHREMANPRAEYLSNGVPATRGTCPVCGTTLVKMGATAAHDGLTKPEIIAAPKKSAGAKKTGKTGKKATRKGTAARRTSASASAAESASGNGRTARATSSATTRKTKSAKKPTKAATSRNAARSTANGNGTGSGRNVGRLVIVESPAKARSIANYLGSGYTVKASKGHVRDLLVSRLSVDVQNRFEPEYRVLNDKRDVVKELQAAVKGAKEVYLATDPDREGEAIAWHLLAATEPGEKPVKRVVFHEITKNAVQEAFQHPRAIDMDLVNAQQARRILDRLVGYQVTELLWEKVRNRLSAGRVQSIAVRMIVDREREIEAFTPVQYWTLDARLGKRNPQTKNDARPFLARLLRIGNDEVQFGSEGDVTPHLAVLQRSEFAVADVKTGERQRKPSPPFTTSTLQQEASRRLGFSASRTMSVAQQLYEGIDLGAEGAVGLITYMRTDSVNVSADAQRETREYVMARFGQNHLPETAPTYKTRAKGAQEAHEAIRPTRVMREPEQVKSFLSSDQYRLYLLVWQRFVASQMANAIYDTKRLDIDAGETPKTRVYHFRASGSILRFAGFLALYEDSRDEDVAEDGDEGRILPDLKVGELVNLLELLPEQHFTQPPPRYTEASLVKALEEFGIGRPSTYAPTVRVITDKEYVVKQDKRLIPTETGKIVNDLLTGYFPEVLDYQFTARMEDQLDTVSEGGMEWRSMLADFYGPFEGQLRHAKEAIPNLHQEEQIGRDCPVCGNPLVVKYGRFGKFIGCSTYPTCQHTEPFLERLGVLCPVCGEEHGGEITVKRSRRGRVFYGCSRWPKCEFTSWKRPIPQPCPNCGGLLVVNNRSTAVCTVCAQTTPLAEVGEMEAEPA